MDIYPLQHDRNIWHMGCNVNYRLHYGKKSCYEFESALSEWRLAVDRRSNDIWPALAARPIPARSASNRCLRRVYIAPVRIRPLSAGNGSSASAARPPSPTRVWPYSSGVCVMVGPYQPARPSASSWSTSRGSFALRLLTYACPHCYDSGAYFQIEKCCGWAYTVIALPVAVRYS